MSSWRPIETAPKDGTRLLAFSPYAHNRKNVHVMRWHQPANGKIKGYWIGSENFSQPTHWQPLPSPPEDRP